MKKHILYSTVLLASASMITGCSENAWNDHLDGFNGDFNYTEKITVSYTLSNSDYEAIGKALAKVATTDEETAAAKAIQSNHYFDQSSVYPAQIAIPYLLDNQSSDYFVYSNGSTAEITFDQAESTPEEISKISSAYTSTIYTSTSESEIPTWLKQKYPTAEEGQYAVVSYLDASSAPQTVALSTSKASAPAINPIFSTRGEYVWSVSEALAKMKDGFRGEAVVMGVISSIDDLSTSYGNATYWIKDSMDDEEGLEVYRGYYLDGEKFTAEDQLVEGATVVVSGNLTVYGETYEFNSGSQILNYYSETTWTVAEALSKMEDGYKGEAIVRGTISSIDDLSTSYGNATYYIKDSLDDEAALQIFRGYYLDGEKFTSEDQLVVGATVVVSGSLTIYNGTYEINSGSKILSYFGPTNSGYDMLTDNIKDLEVGQTLTATAVVTAQCTRGLILTDNGGSILYYNTAVNLSEYPIGTVVEISGPVSDYNKGFQLGNTATIEIKETISYTYPEPVKYTGEMITAAVESTEDMTAEYCYIEGIVTFSGNYINVEISDTSVQGSVYYIPDDLKAELTSGSTYKLTGYFTSFTASYFYIIVTEIEEIIPEVDPYTLSTQIFYYDGSDWEVADGAAVVSPAAYKQMGFTLNDLSDPEIYIPMYLKSTYPYAQSGDEMYVAYNLKSNSCSCALFVFDGSSWSLNDNSLETVTAAFVKSNGTWAFSKYLGQAVFNLFEEDEIMLNRMYMFVSSSSVCANAVLASNSYGYLLTTPVTISGTTIIMPNENNGFQFLSSYEIDGNTITAPEGYFIIQDSNERFMYCQGTYSSFNVSDAPAIDGSTFTDNYLFSAQKNENGSWTIQSKFNNRIVYYSSGYSNFAVYESAGENDSLPYLYQLEEN